MVAHRHVLPVGEQGVFRIAEHLAHVSGVVLAGVEIRVVAHFDRHVHGDGRSRNHARCVQIGAVPELGRVSSEQGLDALAQGDCGRLAKLHQRVQHGRFQHLRGESKSVQQSGIEKGAKVDDVFAQPHPGTGIAFGRRKNAERQVGEREIVPFRHFDPGGHGRVSHGAKVVHDGGFIGALAGRADWIKNTELAW